MTTCPSCKEQVPDSAVSCPKCGERIIAGDTLLNTPKKLSVGQKVLIILGVICLIAIGFTFENAKSREDKAAQELFTQPVERIIRDISMQTGVINQFGLPAYQLFAGTQNAELQLDFAKGQLAADQAQSLGMGVCSALVKTYVHKGYMPTHIRVIVSGRGATYGEAVYNGNFDNLAWQSSKQNNTK